MMILISLYVFILDKIKLDEYNYKEIAYEEESRRNRAAMVSDLQMWESNQSD